MAIPNAVCLDPSADFETVVRDEFRRIKAAEEARTATDRHVKEQIVADLDGVIRKHSPPPPKSMKSVVGAIAALLMLLAAPAHAVVQSTIPYLSGPADPSQLQATINQLIQNINSITSQLIPQTGGMGVNAVSIQPAVSGAHAIIGVQAGGDPNSGISLEPNGTGNVILFGPGPLGGYNPAAAMGMLQIDSQTNFVPANGIATCPGAVPGQNNGASLTSGGVFGPRSVITGYWKIQDWLGLTRYVPVC